MPVRQGDVLCIPVKSIPESARAKKLPEDKDVILAFGEVTGHAHRIKERQLVGFEGAILERAASHTLHYGRIVDEESQHLDDVVVGLYRSPKSYTSEDVVEIRSGQQAVGKCL